MKPKILFLAEYLCGTGFSTVAENLSKNMTEKFDVYLIDTARDFSFFLKNDGVNYTGRISQSYNMGVQKLISIIESFDLLFIINDVWNIDFVLAELKKSGKILPKIVVYFPIDAEDHNIKWYANFDIVSKVFTYTEFAKRVIFETSKGFLNKKHQKKLQDLIHILPHGIDSKQIIELSNKKQLRQELFETNRFDDALIFLNANRNQPRKRLDITIRAFSKLVHETDILEKGINPMLYMHCAIIDSHINVVEYAKRYKVHDRLLLSVSQETPTKKPQLSYDTLNKIYNVCDIGVNSSMGEGWGLCSVEHAITGAAQIVPNHSALEDVFGDNSNAEFVDYEGEYVQDNIMTIGKLVSVDKLCQSMYFLATEKTKDGKLFRDKIAYNAKQRFSSSTFEWKNISENLSKSFISLLQ